MHNFRELKVWKDSVTLSVLVYKISKEFPFEEKYGLTSQVRKCSVSIASNIAEGSSRNSKKDFSHFLSISIGSCFELETQLTIALNLVYLDSEKYDMLIEKLVEVQKMIRGLAKSLGD